MYTDKVLIEFDWDKRSPGSQFGKRYLLGYDVVSVSFSTSKNSTNIFLAAKAQLNTCTCLCVCLSVCAPEN